MFGYHSDPSSLRTFIFLFLQMFLSSNSKTHSSPPPPPPHHPDPQTQPRPEGTSRRSDCPVTKETAKSLLRQSQWNAGICPGPVRLAVPRLSVEALRASQRSYRSTPSKYSLLLHFFRLNMMQPPCKTNYGLKNACA